MTAPANANVRALFVRIWRIRLARWAMRSSRAFNDLAEWLLPEDLRRDLAPHHSQDRRRPRRAALR